MNYVITIARGFGSGGKEIGLKLSRRLGIPCYDHEILRMASEKYGINEALFNRADENLEKSLVWAKLKGEPLDYTVKPIDRRFVSNNNLFNLQKDLIRSIADTESCVIIGKCADYILRNYPNIISFYIEAPRAACVASIQAKMGVPEAEAHRLIEKTDKYRADYYRYYSKGGTWNNPTNYDMTLNSDRIGRDQCVDLMEYYVKSRNL